MPFLFGMTWAPTATPPQYGILPMLVRTPSLVMLGALVLGTPLAIGTAVFLSEVASPRVRAVVRPAVELLAGVPSVVYGFFGLLVLRPVIAAVSGTARARARSAVWIILAIMIVPTIATLSEDALRLHPRRDPRGQLRDGRHHVADHLPGAAARGARSASSTRSILGMGRAIGETMAVVMVVGQRAGHPRQHLRAVLDDHDARSSSTCPTRPATTARRCSAWRSSCS